MFEIKVQSELDVKDDFESVLDAVAEAVPTEFRNAVDSQTPRGRIYQRGDITARRTKRGLNVGFQPKGKTRMIVGRKFHRASAPGQFPAKDTGALYNQIDVVKTGEFSRSVRFRAKHAGFAEKQRPFAAKVSELVVQRFL